VGSLAYALAALAAARPDQPRATMINIPTPGAPPPPSPPPPPPPPSLPPPLDKNGPPGPTDRTDIPRPDPETDTTTRPPDPRSAYSPSWAETGTTNVDGQAATRALNAAAARPDAKIFACSGGLRGSGNPPGAAKADPPHERRILEVSRGGFKIRGFKREVMCILVCTSNMQYRF